MLADLGLEAVVRVDPVSGDRTIISNASTGRGTDFVSPHSIAVEADGNLVVADYGLEAVVRVNKDSDNRTVLGDL